MTSAQVVGGAVITIRPQYASLGPGLNREFRAVAPQMEKHGRDSGTRFVSGFGARIRSGPFRAFGSIIGTGLVAGIGGILGGAAFQGIATLFRTGVGEVQDFSKGLAQTQAALVSTGGAAHVTAGHVEELASSIQDYSGQTDDSIVQAEDLLLTFTKVRNEVGKGNDIFDQATRSVADMSQALGQDTKSSAIQLGKALNDPIKGVTALQRVGVSFDAGQRKQIATMVAHHNVLGAQKVILAELNKEFGGVARSFGQSGPGQIARAKRAFEDVSQSLVGVLLPVFNRAMPVVVGGIREIPVAAAAVGRVVGPAFRTAGVGVRAMFAAFQEGDVTSRGFVGVMERIGVAVGHGRDLLAGWIPTIRSAGTTISSWLLPSLRMVGQFVTGSLVPSLRNLGAVFTGTLLPAIRFVAPIVGGVLLVGFRAVAFLLRDVLGPVLRGVTGFVRQHQTAITSLVVVIGTAVAVYGAYRLIVAGINLVQKAWVIGTNLVKGALISARVAVWLFNTALAANPIGIVVVALMALAAGLVYAYKHSETFRRIVDASFRVVKAVIVGVFTWVKTNWPLLLGILTGPVGLAVVLIVKHWDTIKSTFSTMWDGLKTLVRRGVAAVVDFFLGMISPIVHGAAKAFGWIPGIGGKLQDAARSFDKFRTDTNRALSGINDQKVTVALGWAGLKTFRSAGGNLMFAKGGLVNVGTTPTADDVVIRASKGETVVSANDSRDPGFRAWAAYRSIPGFARGGAVGFDISSVLPSFAALHRTINSFNIALGQAADYVARTLGNQALGGVGAAFTGNASVASVAAATARLLGRPLEAAAWARRIMFESGGNWSAVNRWDSNWAAGHPSVGGAQVIAGTFAANAGRFRGVGPFLYGVSINPLANSYAGGHYAVGRYGSLRAVDPLIRPAGYDVGGGRAWPPGTLGVNLSGETEHVWRRSQLGGGGPSVAIQTLAVDARGATDPAAVRVQVKRGVAEALVELTRMLPTAPGAN